MSSTRPLGVVLIVYAIAFNVPYAWLAANFEYPDILRRPSGEILTAFDAGGGPLILAWFAFMVAALLLAPVAVGLGRTMGTGGVAALGVAAGVTQAIGLSRWVYAVPGLALAWQADAAGRPAIEATFEALHQFAGVGIGETIGQSLTAFWLIGVAMVQRHDPRFGRLVAAVAIVAAVILLLGQVEGLSTSMSFAPGIFGLGALVGFLLLTLWMVWTGVLLIRNRG
jgi:hypothetical protein